jgi:hypothetical protein
MRFSLGLVSGGMIRLAPWLLPAALVLSPTASAQSQGPVVDLDTALRCSALFGIIASEQQRGVASSLADYPPLARRGREFFVQTWARLMDEQQLTREQAQQRYRSEVAKLQAEVVAAPDPGIRTRAIAGPCLTLLDATLPAAP